MGALLVQAAARAWRTVGSHKVQQPQLPMDRSLLLPLLLSSKAAMIIRTLLVIPELCSTWDEPIILEQALEMSKVGIITKVKRIQRERHLPFDHLDVSQ
jgi:hypothetical protein